MKTKRDRAKGVALITALMVVFLMSAVCIGIYWMVMSDQRLGGNNHDRELAFYGAEAGMEKLTADLGNTYATKGAIGASDITTILTTDGPPTIGGSGVPYIQFKNGAGASTYQIICGTPPAACSTSNPPTSADDNILPPSAYSGMFGLITPLTLQVAAQTAYSGSEVKLQRQLQLISLPVFQFGVFSQTDLAFYPSHNMNFGGRVHTNGNLWMDPEGTAALFLAEPVTAVGQVIRSNLENGWPGSPSTISNTYSGYVSIALAPQSTGYATPPQGPTAPYTTDYTTTQWRSLALTEGSVSSYSAYGSVSTTLNNPTWTGLESTYGGMLLTGVPPLNLSSTAIGGITNPIELIQRPVVGEKASNLAEFNEQYFSQASMRILLDDYPSSVTDPVAAGATACQNSDMMSLDGIDTTSNPVNLALLTSAPTWWNSATQTFVPLPTSGNSSGSYTAYNIASSGTSDGYWLKGGKPTITGCIKIEYQDTSNAFHDVTQKILNLGYTGRNIYPSSGWAAPPTLAYLSTALGAGIAAQGPSQANTNVSSYTNCTTDPSANAIIRLERVRDNPSSATAANSYCGSGLSDVTGTDYWPMTLFDTRESSYRFGTALAATPAKEANPQITAQGVMYYTELDAENLATWLNSNQSTLSPNINNNTGFTLYFSDRRGENPDPTNGGTARTGDYGYYDMTNPLDATNGCPNGSLDSGEDIIGDGHQRLYGATPELFGGSPATYYPLSASALPPLATSLPTASPYNYAVLQNPTCPDGTDGTVSYIKTLWPGATYIHTQEARENPPIFFRRALKIVHGSTLNLGTSCYGASPNAPCGLTIASENPVYLQGDYNALAPPSGNSPWSDAGYSPVAAAISADTVTLLSDNWNDVNSFISPYVTTGSFRNAVPTAYRVAIISGKGVPFTWPGSPTADDFGTDGGLQNFMRFLEYWNGGNCWYMGSLVSLYFNHQGVGTYGYNPGNQIYNPPSRQYSFDNNFTLGPQWLPPNTPVLRTINTTGFTQMILPTQ